MQCADAPAYALVVINRLKKALPDDLAGNSTAVFICSLTAAALVRCVCPRCVRTAAAASEPTRLQATGGCYPLDTIRRQMQLKSSTHANVFAACAAIVSRDGVAGLYRGFLPNAAKNLPNSSIRLSTFDAAKRLLRSADEAMKAEEALAAARDAKKGKATKSR